jgi:uncharacterized membrane protein YtjA (UPF0391 family)
VLLATAAQSLERNFPSPLIRAGFPRRQKTGGHMLYYALVALVIAIIAGILGFGGIAFAAAGIAKILFFIFLVIFVVSLLGHVLRGGDRI